MAAKVQRDDSQSCFSPEELAAFVVGRLRKEELNSIAAHIERCPACARLVEATRGVSFPPPGALRDDDRFAEEPEAEELASRALALRPPDESEDVTEVLREEWVQARAH